MKNKKHIHPPRDVPENPLPVDALKAAWGIEDEEAPDPNAGVKSSNSDIYSVPKRDQEGNTIPPRHNGRVVRDD